MYPWRSTAAPYSTTHCSTEVMSKILIIDDDIELCELLSDYLQSEGFEISIANDGHRGLTQINSDSPDLVVMDVMMSPISGFETLKIIRGQDLSLPVIMLTARGDDIDKILGLELGADDYLPKPFNPRELCARIRAILRRSQSTDSSESSSCEIEDVLIRLNSRQVFINQQELDLTSAEFDILHTLIKTAGEICSKEMLTEKGLSRKLEMYDRSIDMHISNLRKKLGKKPDGSDRIKTIRGIGYIYTLENNQ